MKQIIIRIKILSKEDTQLDQEKPRRLLGSLVADVINELKHKNCSNQYVPI